MKKIIIVIIISVSLNRSYGQVTNVRAGLWSDTMIWNINALPTTNDSVTLSFGIIVDINAICQSLNTNGHNLTINPGINLTISGGNITSAPLLKKFIVIDSAQLAPNDTLFIYTYSYDNLHRCIQIEVNDYQNSRIGHTYNFFNGTDTLISSRKLINQLRTDSVFEYFSYSPDGKMVSDSELVFRGLNRVVFTYQYLSVNNSITSIINSSGQPFLLAKYLTTKDNYGNIVSEKDTSFEYYSGTYHYKNNTNISYTYDANPCPFYNLYPKRLIGLNYELVAVDDIPLFRLLQKIMEKARCRLRYQQQVALVVLIL